MDKARQDEILTLACEGSSPELAASGDWSELIQMRIEGRTILHWAAAHGNTAVVAAILANGADPNVRDHCDRTPLHSTMYGSIEQVPSACALLRAGCSIDERDKWLETPLLTACTQSNLPGVCCMLAAGADPSARNEKGQTSLEVAQATLEHVPKGAKFARQREELKGIVGILSECLRP